MIEYHYFVSHVHHDGRQFAFGHGLYVRETEIQSIEDIHDLSVAMKERLGLAERPTILSYQLLKVVKTEVIQPHRTTDHPSKPLLDSSESESQAPKTTKITITEE